MMIQREDPFLNIIDSERHIYGAQKILFVSADEWKCVDIVRKMLKDGDILISGNSIFLADAPDTALAFLPDATDKIYEYGKYFVRFADGRTGVATYKGRSRYYGYEVWISMED